MSERTNPYIRDVTTQVFTFTATEDINRLTATQKVNQKVNLSFYGNKIEMPFKLISASETVTLNSSVATIKGADHELIEAYRVEITQPLGITYFRMDIPKKKTASQLVADAFQLSELNMRSKREFEDYLINRKQYDLEFSTMDLSHRQARLERKYEYVNKGIDLALGALSFAVSGWKGGAIARNWLSSPKQDVTTHEFAPFTGPGLVPVDNPYYPTGQYLSTTTTVKGKRKPIGFKGQQMMAVAGLGAYKGASGIASSITGLISASERATLQEEGFGIQLREKALQSYQIDLGFERDKNEQLFTMRRIFANETYNDVTDRQRQEALDEFEKTRVTGEIYLELWTTSGKQDRYVKDYHDKFGVDCRVPKDQLFIKDEMRVGIYCLEDVEIYNLQDRIEIEYLKARLTGGIKFVKWIEHELVKELSPVDQRILELQGELAKVKRAKLEEQQQCQQQIQELQGQVSKASSERDNLQERYTTLAEDFRKKEAELSTQTNLAVLYKNESIHCKQDLLKKDSEHAQEKEQHSATKEQLAQKDKEIQDLKQEKENLEQQKSVVEEQAKQQTLQINTLTQQVQSKTTEVEEQKRQLASCQEEVQQLRGAGGLQPEVDRLTKELEEKTTQYQAKERELEETKNTLAGVRSIREQLEKEIKEEIWKKPTFKQIMNYQPLVYKSKPENKLYPYVITGGVKEGDNTIYICQFVEDRMCYVHQPNLGVKKYDSYGFIRITDKSNPQLLERNYPLNNWSNYWSRNITTWKDFYEVAFQKGNFFKNETNMMTTNLQIRILEPDTAFPCFLKTPSSLDDKPIGDEFKYSIKEGWKGHKAIGTYIDKKYSKVVTNYREYLEAMGLEAVIGKNNVIEKIVAKKKISAVA